MKIVTQTGLKSHSLINELRQMATGNLQDKPLIAKLNGLLSDEITLFEADVLGQLGLADVSDSFSIPLVYTSYGLPEVQFKVLNRDAMSRYAECQRRVVTAIRRAYGAYVKVRVITPDGCSFEMES